MTTPRKRPTKPPAEPTGPSELPMWLRVLGILVLLACFAFNLAWDATHDNYSAQPVTLALIALFGTAFGLNELRKGGKQ